MKCSNVVYVSCGKLQKHTFPTWVHENYWKSCYKSYWHLHDPPWVCCELMNTSLPGTIIWWTSNLSRHRLNHLALFFLVLRYGGILILLLLGCPHLTKYLLCRKNLSYLVSLKTIINWEYEFKILNIMIFNNQHAIFKNWRFVK